MSSHTIGSVVFAMSNDDSQAELLAWKKQRAQKKQQQQDTNERDEFAALLDEEGDKRYKGNTVDDDDVPYVPLAKRKKLEKEALIGGMAHRRRHLGFDNTNDKAIEETKTAGDENNNNNDDDDSSAEQAAADPKTVESLLDSVSALHDSLTEEERAERLRKEEEARIMKEASKVQTNALQAASELAKGIEYKDSMPSTWVCPRYILNQGEAVWEKVRKEWHMECEGVDIPPPCKRFVDMKFAPPILEVLKRKGIKKPTPIQMQGLTVVRYLKEAKQRLLCTVPRDNDPF